MGAAASTHPALRLRKALVMRAYNARTRPSNTSSSSNPPTLEQQFRPYAEILDSVNNTSSSVLVISIKNIKKCLDLDSKPIPWVDRLLEVLFEAAQTSSDSAAALEDRLVDYKAFIEFLESGVLSKALFGDRKGDMNGRFERPCLLESQSEPILKTHSLTSQTSPSSTYHSISPNNLSTNASVNNNPGFKSPSVNEQNTLCSTEVVIHKPRTIALNRKDAHRPTNLGKQLWQKREVVKQEKTIHYTTIDELGEIQELVESETHQTEILHMECRETGEFAHRETTHFEHTEVFNNDLVDAKQGTEIYVHLKSKDDEIEYGESNMPPREPMPEPGNPQDISENQNIPESVEDDVYPDQGNAEHAEDDIYNPLENSASIAVDFQPPLPPGDKYQYYCSSHDFNKNELFETNYGSVVLTGDMVFDEQKYLDDENDSNIPNQGELSQDLTDDSRSID